MRYRNPICKMRQVSDRQFGITIFVMIILVCIFISYDFDRLKSQRHMYGDEPPGYKDVLLYKDESSQDANRKFNFDPNGNKIIVILHIQKTGGTTFESRLVETLNVTPRCVCRPGEKRCECINNNGHVWIVSGQKSLRWPCGLHADWTEWNECIDGYFDELETLHRDRSYLYVTMLREPIQRYISEWKHVQQGATWIRYKGHEIKCNRQKVTEKELPKCFKSNWINVQLNDFIKCPHNLAINRQTRMLANLSLVDCYNTSTIPKPERDRMMLESAKNNLRNMAYFGLTEYQELNQHLFEFTFGVNFTKDFSQKAITNAVEAENVISSSQLESIKELNNLDIELYKYAKKLYFQRIDAYNIIKYKVQ
ncbi:unnamed protein product, partial [Owenia fusiformis]